MGRGIIIGGYEILPHLFRQAVESFHVSVLVEQGGGPAENAGIVKSMAVAVSSPGVSWA